jgi:y4mF family transcriptional regulator
MARAARPSSGQNKLRAALENFSRETQLTFPERPGASASLKADLDDPTFRTLVGAAFVLDPTLLTRIGQLAPHADIKPANQQTVSNTLKQALSGPGRPDVSGAPVATVTDLGVLVRQARQAMGLSQQDFADLAGLGRRFVSELESGKPTLEFGRVLIACSAAGIDIMAKVRTTS